MSTSDMRSESEKKRETRRCVRCGKDVYIAPGGGMMMHYDSSGNLCMLVPEQVQARAKMTKDTKLWKEIGAATTEKALKDAVLAAELRAKSLRQSEYKDTPNHAEMGNHTGYCVKCNKHVGLNPLGTLKVHWDENGAACNGEFGNDTKPVSAEHHENSDSYVLQREISTYVEPMFVAGEYATVKADFGETYIGSSTVGKTSANGVAGAVKYCEGCGRFIQVDADGNMLKHTLFTDHHTICSQQPTKPLADSKPYTGLPEKKKLYRCPECGNKVPLNDVGLFVRHHIIPTSLQICEGSNKTYAPTVEGNGISKTVNPSEQNYDICPYCANKVEVDNTGCFVVHNTRGGFDSRAKLCKGSKTGAGKEAVSRAKSKNRSVLVACPACGKHCEANPDGSLPQHTRRERIKLSDGTAVEVNCDYTITQENSKPPDTWIEYDLNQIMNEEVPSQPEMGRPVKRVAPKPHGYIPKFSSGGRIQQKYAVPHAVPIELDNEDELEEEPGSYPDLDKVHKSKDGIISIW